MRKQTFALVGIGAVLTLSAASVLRPVSAYAVSTDVQVNVNVLPTGPLADITSIQDGQKFFRSNVDVDLEYANAETVQYTLVHKDKTGAEHTYNFGPHQVGSVDGCHVAGGTCASGVHSWLLDLSTYGYGDFTLYATVNGNGTAEDSVTFSYSSSKAWDTGTTEESTGDPIIGIETDDEVTLVKIQVFDEEGHAMFVELQDVDVNGKNIVEVPLDFLKNNVPSGTYRVVGTSYSRTGEILGDNFVVVINYARPNLPEVPNTGMSLFESANLSGTDIALAFLVVFGLASLIGFGLLRKNRKEARK